MSDAATEMYTLKPVISLPEKIPLPTVMYELPRIQGSNEAKSTDDIASSIAEQLPRREYDLLEARQVRILNQIYELKQQIECLCVAARLSDVVNPNKLLSQIDFNFNETPVHAEIIVSANPTSPPYFILALQRLWSNTKFNVEVHRHSTLSHAATTAFEEKLLSSSSKDFVHTIDLKLIWKNVSDVQLVTKVYDYPIEGEANILRYLTRLIEKYNYESSKSLNDLNTIDTILDLCLRLPYEDARNINAVTSKIARYLCKKTWLLNDNEPSIVDVAAWSAIKRIASNRVPRELKNWYDLCEKTFLSV